MAANFAVVTGTIPTSGSVDLESPGFGTPTAAIIYTVRNGDSYRFSTGFWDGTRQSGIGIAGANGASTTNTSKLYSTTNILNVPNTSATLVNLQGSCAAITNGIRITPSTYSGATDAVICVLISGTTNVYAGTHTFANNTDVQDVTSPGFKPDLVFAALTTGTTTSPSSDSIVSMGVAHNNSADSITQATIGFYSRDALSATDSSTVIMSDKVAAVVGASQSLTYETTISAFDASGFSLQNSSATTDTIHYLAIELPDPDDANVQVIDSATSTGNSSITGTGFTPSVLFLYQTVTTAVDSITAGLSFAAGIADATNQYSVTTADEDNQATTDSQNVYDGSNVLNIDFDGGTGDALAAKSSFDSNGYTLNYSDASASARKMISIAIGDSTAGGVTANPHNPFGHPFLGAFGGPI